MKSSIIGLDSLINSYVVRFNLSHILAHNECSHYLSRYTIWYFRSHAFTFTASCLHRLDARAYLSCTANTERVFNTLRRHIEIFPENKSSRVQHYLRLFRPRSLTPRSLREIKQVNLLLQQCSTWLPRGCEFIRVVCGTLLIFLLRVSTDFKAERAHSLINCR